MAIDLGDGIIKISGDTAAFRASLGKLSRMAGVAMTAAGAAITGALGLSIKSAMTFQDALAELATLGIEDMAAMEDAIKDVSLEFGIGLVDATKAAYQAISAGATEAEAPKLLADAAIAAKAGISDLTTAIELGTSVTNAFGGEIKDVNQIYDQAFIAVKYGVTTFNELAASVGKLSPTFVGAGLSSAEMFASIATLTKGGLSTSEAVTYLNAAVNGFTRQGEIAKLETLGLKGALDWLKESTGGNQQAMLKFLGSTEGLKAVLSLTGVQAQMFTKILEETESATGATDAAFKAFAESSPGFAFDKLKVAVELLAVEIGQQLMPDVVKFVRWAAEAVKGVIAWVRENKEMTGSIAKIAGVVGGLLLVLGPILIMLPGLKILFLSVASVLGGVSLKFIAIAAAIGAVAVALAVALRPALQAAKVWIKANWDQIVRIFDLAVRQTMAILKAYGNVIRAVFTVVGAVLTGFGLGVADTWEQVTGDTKLGTMSFLDLVEYLTKQATIFLESLAVYIGRFADWIARNWDNIVAGTRWMVRNVLEPLGYLMREFVRFANTVTDTWNSIPAPLRRALFGGAAGATLYGGPGALAGAAVGAFTGGGRSAASGGTGTNNNLTFTGPVIGQANIASGQDARKLAREFTDELGRIMGAQGQRLGALAS